MQKLILLRTGTQAKHSNYNQCGKYSELNGAWKPPVQMGLSQSMNNHNSIMSDIENE